MTTGTKPISAKARGSAFYSALGKKGGNAVKEKYGPDYFKTIGRRGGRQVGLASSPRTIRQGQS